MMKNTKNIAFTLILALFFSLGATGLSAAGSGRDTAKAPKRVERVSEKAVVKKTNALEVIQQGDEFYMEMNSWMRGDIEVQVLDIDGNVVQSTQTRIDSQDNTLKFKAANLDKGFYKIKVLTSARVQKKNIVID